MKILLTAALIALAFVTGATPAAAYVVAVPTSVAASTMADDTDLKAAIRSAVDDVLSHAIAFSPTFVTVQTARVIGGRVYILLLIGDEDGEKMLEKLSAAPRGRSEQRHDVTEFTSSFCSLYDAACRGPVFCESDGAAVHRPPRQHSNESDMALDGRDIALIAVACDEIFFGRAATVIRPAASYSKREGRNSDGG